MHEHIHVSMCVTVYDRKGERGRGKVMGEEEGREIDFSPSNSLNH